jgi:hypothetical protein
MTGIILVVEDNLFVECGGDWVGFDFITVSNGISLKYAFLISVAHLWFELIVMHIDSFIILVLIL